MSNQNIRQIPGGGEGLPTAEPARIPVLVVVPFGADQHDIDAMRQAIEDEAIRDGVAEAIGLAANEQWYDAEQREANARGINRLYKQAQQRMDDEYWLEPEHMPFVLDACHRRVRARPRMDYGAA